MKITAPSLALAMSLSVLSGGLGPSAATTRGAAVDMQPAQVLINEVCWWQSCFLDVPAKATEIALSSPTTGRASVRRMSGPWIELFNNTATQVDLDGWRLLDADGDMLAELPDWQLPAGAYVLVFFEERRNYADFSRARGVFFAGKPFGDAEPNGESDAAILVDDLDALVDVVAWGELGTAFGGAMIDQAVNEGHWPLEDAFALADHYSLFLTPVVREGTSFGRSMSSDDTNSSDDWQSRGGSDASGNTPGRQNLDPDLILVDTEGSAAAAKAPPVIPPDPGGRVWTVMFYVDGREKKLGATWHKLMRDISKIEYSNQVAFVAQYTSEEGSDSSSNEQANDRTRRMAFYDGFQHRLKNNDVPIGAGQSTNPGDPEALKAFINWAEMTYPAAKYALIMVGHGRGWKGTNITEDNEDFLIMSELEEGLQALDRKFDILLFESCLMGTVEVAYQVADEVERLVASEEVMWTYAMPWVELMKSVRDNPAMTPEELALGATDGYREDALKLKVKKKFTISYILPDKVKSDVFPAVQTFAQALMTDVEEIKDHDVWQDNLQVTIFEQVLRPSEKFFDGSFRDLGHVALLAKNQPELSASGPAQMVIDALMPPDGAIVRSHRGTAHPNATGLSIYFPRAQTQPDLKRKKRADLCAHREKHCGEIPAFDHPWQCPHIYARDPDFRLPELSTDGNHTMVEDGDFHFTDDGGWDEFLHRFYKPVADACIRTGGSCVKSVSIEVGQSVVLSGHGTSDIDTDGENDDEQTNHQPNSWHWDLNVNRDSTAMIQDYQYDVLYPCAQEDCDRDDVDGRDDDPDRAGETVNYTCSSPGSYTMRLMAWDDHNSFVKLFHEDEQHNTGKHWLHFNIDDDEVTVQCTEPPMDPSKRADKAEVQAGQDLEYEIMLPPGSGVAKGLEPASIVDQLPPEAIFVDGSLQCPDIGFCSYDEEGHQVIWEGEIGVEETARLVFVVLVRDDAPCEPDPTLPPAEIVNRADVQRGGDAATVTATTTIDCGIAASRTPAVGARAQRKK